MSVASTALGLVGTSRAAITSEYNSIVGTSFPDGTDWCAIFCTVALAHTSTAHPEWYSALANDWRVRGINNGYLSGAPDGSGNTFAVYDYDGNGTTNHLEVVTGGNGNSFDVVAGNAPSLGTTDVVGTGHRTTYGLQGFINLPYTDLTVPGSESGVGPWNPENPQCEVFDYSASRPSPSAMSQAGIKAVMRYLGTIWPTKGLHPDEVTALHDAGIAIGLIYERDGKSWRGGFAAGVADATEALGWMQDLGAPMVPVAFAMDEPGQNDDPATVEQYMLGAQSVIPGSYPYATAQVLDYMGANGTLPDGYGWQTYAWSGGQVSQYTGLYQYSNGENWNGSTVDYNDLAYNVPWFWLADGSVGSVSPSEDGVTKPPSDPDPVTPSIATMTYISYVSDAQLALHVKGHAGYYTFNRFQGKLWKSYQNLDVKEV